MTYSLAGGGGVALTAPSAATAGQQSAAGPRRSRMPVWWRLGGRSLAARLVAAVVVLAVALIVVPGGVTYVALRSTLNHRLDQQLQSAAQGSVLYLIEDAGHHGADPLTIWVVQLGPTGTVLDHLPTPGVGHVKHLNVTSSERRLLAHPDPNPRDVTTADGTQVRVISEQQPGVAGTVVLGLSTGDVTHTLHELLLVELALAAGAALLTVVVAVAVRRSLTPLHQLTSTAREITTALTPDGAGLERRAPVDRADADSEVGQLTSAVNTLLGAVQEQFTARVDSEQRMRQFLADASHELRTPLTSIRGYAELAHLQRRRDGRGNDDFVDRIQSEGTRMAVLVEDLLLLARGDQDQVAHRQPVDMAAVAEEAVELALVSDADRSISLTSGPVDGLVVDGDRDQLLRVLRNLITNAAIHTRPDGDIRVTLAVDPADDRYLTVDVADDGPGLTTEQSAHVFERFWRSDQSRVRSTGGSGLGLSIVASIITAHHGTIAFTSTVETGTTVHIRLPRHP